MSSSDEEYDKKSSNKPLFVNLLSENTVIFDKSRVPKIVTAKKNAWDKLCKQYSSATGIPVTPQQMIKMLNNMKSIVKKKTDLKETGNKPIKLKDWEKDLLLLLTQEDNPVFTKVPGGVALGLEAKKKVPDTSEFEDLCVENDVETDFIQQNIDEPSTSSSSKFSRTVKKLPFETDDTKNLTTPQLQRQVLLQQMELQKIQIEKEKKELEKFTKVFENKYTQTS